MKAQQITALALVVSLISCTKDFNIPKEEQAQICGKIVSIQHGCEDNEESLTSFDIVFEDGGDTLTFQILATDFEYSVPYCISIFELYGDGLLVSE